MKSARGATEQMSSANDLNIKVLQVSWHRNGIGGEGFYAVLFTADVDFKVGARFLATMFDSKGQCAVICLDKLESHGVEFGENSWRGDEFEPHLRKAVNTMDSAGSVRIGPFGMPTKIKEDK